MEEGAWHLALPDVCRRNKTKMKTKYDTIVIGGGKFGCVAALALQNTGQSVLLIDDSRPMGGSRPSGGLMKPSWMACVPKPEQKRGMELLNTLYGVDDIELDLMEPLTGKRLSKVTAHHIEVTKVLDDKRFPRCDHSVVSVEPGRVYLEHLVVEAKRIVVAAGHWTNKILPEELRVPGLYGKRGVSFVFQGTVDAFIRPWAPYKQIVVHKHEPGKFWGGDGTALLPEKWTVERQAKTEQRVCKAVGRQLSEATLQHGIRPFVDGVTNKNPCYFAHHKNPQGDIFVLTGGGKNGMIASAWCANQILETL